MLYNVALFVHILGAIGYFVALGIVYASVAGLRRARSVQPLRLWATAGSGAARILSPISGLCILAAGVYMVFASWGWGTDWVLVGLGAYLVAGAASGTLQIRRLAMLARQARDLPADGPLPAALVAQARDSSLWVATNAITAFSLGIVFLMTVKPNLLGSLAALIVALVVGLVAGLATQGQQYALAASAAQSS